MLEDKVRSSTDLMLYYASFTKNISKNLFTSVAFKIWAGEKLPKAVRIRQICPRKLPKLAQNHKNFAQMQVKFCL